MRFWEEDDFTGTITNSIQFFLAHLLALLAGQPCFRLEVDFTIGLAIGKVELMGGEVAVGFSGWFL